MTRDQIIQKFKDMGLNRSEIDLNTWFLSNNLETWIGIDIKYIPKNNKSILCILIGEDSRHMGSIYSYEQGIKKIQKIIQNNMDLSR